MISQGLSAVAPMLACRVNRFGAPSVVTLERTNRPVRAKGKLLVRVEVAGVDPWDCWIRASKSVLPKPLPLTLGSDLAGIVEAVGSDLFSFRSGFRSLSLLTRTSSAPTMKTPSPAPRWWRPVPPSWANQGGVRVRRRRDCSTGAGVSGPPRRQDHSNPPRGRQRRCLRSLARASRRRARDHHRRRRDLGSLPNFGANSVIDHQSTAFATLFRNPDAVLTSVGGETQLPSSAVLPRGGALISAVSESDQRLAARHDVGASFFLVDVTTDRLTELAGLIQAGALTTSVSAVLPLTWARAAHELLNGRRSRPRGKVVLSTS
jgi:NADPH:quinone reductase-like Zn-dependent oxidoreductase